MTGTEKDKHLKILIVHNQYRIPGGEDTVVENEQKMLEEQGHLVVLYTRSNKEIDQFSFIQKLFLPFNALFSFKTYQEIKHLIRDNGIDILHVHNTLSLISPSVYYAAFQCKVPVVQTVHNFRLICPGAVLYRGQMACHECVQHGLVCALRHKCYRNSLSQTLVSVLILLLHRMLGTYKRLNYICLTEFNRDRLLEGKAQKIFSGSRIFIKPNFAENNISFVPYADRKKQFVFVGRPETVKGIRILLEAWKNIKEYSLLICGDSNEMNWCYGYIKENEMSNVSLLGRVSNRKVKELLSESMAMILPTQLYEGFPMTIVESFSCGTPVIGSNLGNVANLIEDKKTGFLFCHTSSEDLKEKVYGMYDMTEECLRTYETEFSKEKNYNKLIEIYLNASKL